MPEHAPTLQLIGVAVLAVAAVVWAVVLMRLLRRAGRRTVVRRSTAPLPALPSQTRVGPSRESVELTPAEQDAFAGLVRYLANG
ncbi:hypothetical protein [Streptomyces olivaceoviridis]|uniref:hypothetical protein n=1 Tax=Streptomyces olivaceoviridis TaxID=1921 RepID=UPI00024BC76D|nr:hypothetical protein SHJG_4666 [Streptomyces hygroscopicus subsp. jinggangensis 5008]AGF64093.1 hypothetical protein SHJGH_4428 [Streptomyces hygroscopicus subsp. jinggangensis TL01]